MSLKIFAAEALTDFSTTAAISPSSSHLASAMLEPLPLQNARVVVELGAGTGVMTRALLDALPPQAKLVVFEINHRFFNYMKNNFSDPRLILINSSAANLDAELRRRGIHKVEAVVSSLGLGFMSDRQRLSLFRQLIPYLHRHSVMTQYQYIHGMQFHHGHFSRLNLRPLLDRYFASVQSRIVWRNLPPAIVFSCHAKSA